MESKEGLKDKEIKGTDAKNKEAEEKAARDKASGGFPARPKEQDKD